MLLEESDAPAPSLEMVEVMTNTVCMALLTESKISHKGTVTNRCFVSLLHFPRRAIREGFM
jgi:hypothetical protein